jgi:D-alanine-D-alanine ligase-like ATP-grasp enzyme
MAFSSVKKKINANQRKHCFEIFGLDFFIDSELKVWLIEVNENPCI